MSEGNSVVYLVCARRLVDLLESLTMIAVVSIKSETQIHKSVQ
jgi:hypothetical protein